jgi:hypothetical protein
MVSEPSYEDVAYPGGAFPAMHPEWLASVAWLHGLPMPEVVRARVIEFGCGDGGMLIPLALAMPEARFLGVDLSPGSIARGAARAELIGLRNVSFAVGDLTTFDARAAIDAQGAPFDFVLAHGVYSWVPAVARQALLKLYAGLLSETGIGYLSFAAYPGGHLDQLLYDMACLHASRVRGGPERVASVRRFARALIDAVPNDHAVWNVLRHDLQLRLETAPDSMIAHDVISDSNERVWLHDMVARLEAAGLQHVADAALSSQIELRPAKVQAFMDLAGDDPLMRAQYFDMARLARFRQIVIARKGAAPTVAPLQERMRELKLRATITAKESVVPLTPGTPATFVSNRGLEFTIDESFAKAAMLAIAAALPHGLGLAALADASAQILRAAGLERAIEPEPEAYLARTLIDLVGYKALMAYLHDPPVAPKPGARPLASPLARLQLANREPSVNLWLETFNVGDPVDRLMPLLDGTRDRPSLATALGVSAEAIDGMIGALHREGFMLA